MTYQAVLPDGQITHTRTTAEYRKLLPEDKQDLFSCLCALRTELSKQEKMPAYIILSNRSLYEMCLHLPENESELASLPYVGKKRAEKYGAFFLHEIRHLAGEPRAHEGAAV